MEVPGEENQVGNEDRIEEEDVERKSGRSKKRQLQLRVTHLP